VWLACLLPTIIIDRGFMASDAAGRVAFSVAPDWRVLIFTSALAALTCLAFGLAPALHASRPDVVGALKGLTGNVKQASLRAWLLGLQVAVSVLLVATAAVLARGIHHARHLDRGFDVEGVTVVSFDLPASYSVERKDAFSEAFLRVAADVTNRAPVAGAARAPFEGDGVLTFVHNPARSASAGEWIQTEGVSPAFFEVLGIPRIAGRRLEPGDAGRHRIVVSEALARRYWSGHSPLGRILTIARGANGDRSITGAPAPSGSYEIVGVVASADLGHGLGEPTIYELLEPGYLAASGMPADLRRAPRILVRDTTPERLRLVAAMAARIEPRVRIGQASLAANLDGRFSEERFVVLLAAIVGLTALALASVGVSGIFAYQVRQRSSEIGIRMALGARPSQIVRGIVGSGARPLAIGLGAGLLAALGAGQLLRSNLWGLSPLDPRAYAGVAVVLAVAAVAAIAVPAWRAARVDPLQALRAE
jgi:predicted permease